MNPDGSSDRNTISLYETDSFTSPNYQTIDGSDGTAALKITSKATNIQVTATKLVGGSENAIDLNNECSGITVSFDELTINGKYGISAKTCSDVIFRGHMSGQPSQWGVNLGSWSDQSAKTQTGTHLALAAGTLPITVWLGNAEMPTFDDPKKYKVIGFGKYGPLVRFVVMFFWSIAKKLKLA